MAAHPLRIVSALLRSALALAVLGTALFAAPYAILRWGSLPHSLPTISGVQQFLSGPADDSLLQTAITLVGLAAWACFALSVVLELAALLRHQAAPRLRGLGAFQGAAGFLIGSIVLLAPTAASAATLTATSAAAAAHHATTVTAPGGTSAPRTGTTAVRHTTTRAETTLWDLADTHLGDGLRWRQIADLNPQLAEGPIPAGTVVRLPADSTTPPPPSGNTPRTDDETTAARAPSPTTHYIVRTGDDLSDIAQDKLGDASRWQQIFRLNEGEQQPGGARFTDPDLIYPGQNLALPGAAATAPEAPPATADHTPAPEHHASPAPSTSASATSPSLPRQHGGASTPEHQTAPATPTSTPTPPAGTPTPSAAVPSLSEPTSTATATPDLAHSPAPATASTARTGAARPVNDRLMLLLGGGLLAASILTALGARRIWQQRSRRPGHRIAMPTGSAAATETALRAAEDPTGTTLIDAALRTAAVHLADDRRELPDLAAIVYGPRDGLTLHLATPAPPVMPFTAEPEDQTRWHCPPDTEELLDATRTDDVDAPYPSLVAIGGNDEGHTVLIDLEHHGTVRVTGSGRRDVMRALAVDLATSVLADCLEATVTGPVCPGLAALVPERLTEAADPATAVRQFSARHAAQQKALSAVGSDGMRAARTGGDNEASWTPHLLLADHDFDQDTWQHLTTVTEARPRTASAIVTTSDTNTAALGAGWQVVCDGSPVTVPGTTVSFIPLALTDTDYADIMQALSTTTEPDLPAPHAQTSAPETIAPPDGAPAAATAPAESQHEADRLRYPAQDGEPVLAWADDSGEEGEDLIAQLAGDLEDPGLDDQDADGTEFANDDGTLPTAAAIEVRTPDDYELARSAEPPVANAPVAAAALVPAEPAEPGPVAVSAEEADEPSARQEEAGLMIRVLGPVEVTGAGGTIDSRYRRTSTELAAWMVLNPGSDHHALDEAIWPGKTVSRGTRNPAISRLRTWLGTNEAGQDHLPKVATNPDVRYRLATSARCDWLLFQHLAATGTDDSLRAALELVRGRPFAGVPARHYVWAEPLIQEMIAAIVDAAADLGASRLEMCDPRGALWAASKGLDAAPEMEVLHRIAFRAHHALGDHQGLERAIQRLENLLFDLQTDMDNETSGLLHQLATLA
ncbi:LysM peptidoglycan-binding domain-containing protein [Streptomyces sp. PTM05]|uniref:LysM peptidoglycan-binding domain-containing protein n=1 Tax=Streptantibioticus parmotrematis TaxID=2873249 RepID=A0ABS7R1C2_9ACTN|nr:LysM peptidoglycan-binding domain-containing protein [Streptantibioticus parmotrematis]MBY8889241.1 LysM peptidoglycan-binding domain-containing protein [Streptantibioticus parmotrematis]